MSREKIEEIARDLCECYNDDGTCYCDNKPCDLKCEYFTDAQYIYEKGYRKQSEGEWENVYNHDTSDGHLQRQTACSVCGYKPKGDINAKTPYCPNCGAKMKGSAE